MELEIYDRQGALKRKVSPDSSSRWTEEVGAEFVVTVNFTTWEFFVLSVGDYVEISGKRFSIKKEYRPKKIEIHLQYQLLRPRARHAGSVVLPSEPGGG